MRHRHETFLHHLRNAETFLLALGLILSACRPALAQTPITDKSVDSYTTAWNTNAVRITSREARAYSSLLANHSGTTVYIMAFDAASLAAVTNNATPIWVSIPVATGTVGTLETPYSVPLENGLCLAASSTLWKLTLVSSTNLAWTTFYRDRR
jgi:hypothetical protein